MCFNYYVTECKKSRASSTERPTLAKVITKTQSTLQNDNQFAETKAFLQEKHKKRPYLPFIIIPATLNIPPLNI